MAHGMCNAVIAAPEMVKFASQVEKHLKAGKTMSHAMRAAADDCCGNDGQHGDDTTGMADKKFAMGGRAACNASFEEISKLIKGNKK